MPKRPETPALPSKENLISELRRISKIVKATPTQADWRKHARWSWRAWEREFKAFAVFVDSAGMRTTSHGRRVQNASNRHADSDALIARIGEQVRQCGNFYRSDSRKRFKTALVISDLHDKHLNRWCMSVAIDVARNMQPDYIIINGDLFDMYEFSRFNHDPRHYDIPGRFAVVRKEILGPIRAACPNAQIDLVIGNHEFRVIKIVLDKSPHILALLSDIAGLELKDLFGLREFGVNIVSKIDLAAWKASSLKQNFQVYDECYVPCHEKNFGFGMAGTSGHTHRPSISFDRNIAAGAISWMVTGCMCETDDEYIDGMPSAIQAFGRATIDTKKKQVSQELIAMPGDHVVVDGKLYIRG